MSNQKSTKPTGHRSLTPSSQQFPVIGVGASAGGLDAFKRLIKTIPEKSGIAFVLVQHLSPDHESLLPSLLQKVTAIPVVEISNDIELKPNIIYVIPSNKMLIANDGVLHLTERPSADKIQRNPIDLFFTSLAVVHQSHAMGVVLSGSAADGTAGLKAIKEHGGVTFAQDNASAAYREMPSNAIHSGVVDFVMAPEDIAAKIIEVVASSKLIHDDETIINKEHEESFKQILQQLRLKKGTDFSFYKQTTIRRRILRRMALGKFKELAEYRKKLSEDRDELDRLYQDLLIPVSAFFRDAASFDHLCGTVLPEVISSKPVDPIRIWVAGCSTGEEAYSLAMCLKEHLGEETGRVQIFASDISEPAIAKARAGVYSKADIAEVSAKRLNDFFIRSNGSYHVIQSIRDMCVFAVHNFLKDPPFGKQDLISCRNVMIYMDAYLQKKAFTTFHYALNARGFLVLGKSESITLVSDLFSVFSKSDKIYRRKDGSKRAMPVLSSANERIIQKKTESKSLNLTNDFQRSADQILLSKYIPVGVVVNESLDIVHFKGNTGAYLEPSPGKPTLNLLKMARAGLSFELRNLIHKARKNNDTIKKEKIPFGEKDNLELISLEVIPLPDTIEPHYLVLFHKAEQPKTKGRKSTKSKVKQTKEDNSKDLQIIQLREELTQLREDMRSISEEQEASNEELQSSNEELLSSSEELQSLNEELETSKEELQSSLEELTIINQEISGLNELLSNAKNYAEAIVSTVAHPILILDEKLHVKSANRSFYNYFKTDESGTEDKHIFDLGNRQWDIPSLRKLLEELLPQKKMFLGYEVTHSFPSIGTRTLLLNARELGGRESNERLILLAFDDITEQRDINVTLEKAVELRTRELSEANLELKRANAELESFSYIASHDLQEPLRKIQVFSSQILKAEADKLSENGADFFKRIQLAVKRMQALINDLLSFSRITSSEPKFETVSLKDIISDVILDLQETIEEKKAIVKINNICDADIIPFQFRQLMYNLMSNALKFNQPGTVPHITIESNSTTGSAMGPANLVHGKHYCHISVMDNGIGFDEEYRERIFDVFQRLHGNAYEGTGIGLAIAKKVVENHGGIITAMSMPGKGSTFNVYLPVR